jgi:hypothetical protein
VATPGRRAVSLSRLHDPVSLTSPRVLARWRASTMVRLRSPYRPERRALNPLAGDRFSRASAPVGGPRRRRGDRPSGEDR